MLSDRSFREAQALLHFEFETKLGLDRAKEVRELGRGRRAGVGRQRHSRGNGMREKKRFRANLLLSCAISLFPPEVLAWLQSEVLESDKTAGAARDQEIRRQRGELERLQSRLSVLYDDRLDGRIDTELYDAKAGEIRERIQQFRSRIRTAEDSMLLSATEAVNLMALASQTADLFIAQTGAEQRKLLHLVLGQASWKGGELRMSFRQPFEQLRLSNSITDSNHNPLDDAGSNSGNWRRGRDSNSRYSF